MDIEALETRNLTRRRLLHTAIFALVEITSLIFLYSQCDSYTYIIGAAIIILLSVSVYLIFLSSNDLSLLKRYIIASLVSGVIFTFAFPPISVPDEMYHFTASYWYASSVLGESDILDSSSISIRKEDRSFVEDLSQGNVTAEEYAKTAKAFSWFESSDEMEAIEGYSFDLGSNPPQLKLPSAFGILIARLLHLGSVPLFYFGRIINLLYFIVLTSLAIRFAPIGKSIFCAVSMLPMTLHLAASYSYDGGILGLSFLFVSLLLKAIFENGPIEKREILSLAVVAILLAPCKVIYSVAVAMVVFIPNGRFASRKQSIIFKIALPLMMLCSVIILRLPAMLTMAGGSVGPQTHDGITGNYYTLGALLTDPIGSALMLMKTIFAMFDFYWISAIGGSLSRFQGSIAAPHYLVVIYLVLLFISTIPESSDDNKLTAATKTTGIICFLLSVLGSMVAMWIGWTFDNESIIQGVQGRYFLPLLPLFLIAIRPKRIIANFPVSESVVSASFILNSMYMIFILFCAFSSLG